MSIDLSALVLNWVASYGAPMAGALLLVGAIGVPLPLTLLVIASGAFVRQDLLNFSTPFIALACTVGGDLILFGIGNFARKPIEKRYGLTPAWIKARGIFERRGGWAIFLTRWLFTPIAFPTTLVAGSSHYRLSRFFAMDLAGEALWIAIYGGLGYAFGSQWELINEFISNFSGFIFGALVLGVGIFLMVRFRKKPALQTVQSTPGMENEGLQAGG